MPVYKTKAIIIKTRNLGDSNRIVTALTEKFGKISGVAKGSRRIRSRFCGGLEMLNYCHLLYFGREDQNLYSIGASDTIESFVRIKEDLNRLSIALCIIELIDTMVRESYVNAYIFQFLLSTISAIEKSKDSFSILRVFEIRLMSILGYMPELKRCIVCNRVPDDDRLGFDYKERGIVCRDCFRDDGEMVNISQGTLRFLAKSTDIGGDKVDRLKIPRKLGEEISNITQRYIRLYTNKELKSYRFMIKLRRG